MIKLLPSTLLLLIAATSAASAAQPQNRPNIILAMADDMGWGDVAYNGHPVLRTPNLDEMAKAGLRFDRFYAPTVCSPTRGSCLTGRHPFRYGITNANVGRLPPEERTLAEALKSLGYTTGHFGKWHLGTLTNDLQDGRRGGRDPQALSPPWIHGFDVCFSTEQAVPTWDPAENQPFLTKFWTGAGEYATENLSGDDSRVMMDRVIPFIRGAVAAEKPFLALVWFHAPHQPFKAGEAYREIYSDRRGREQHYYGCITALDEQMGRLRRELRDLGVAQDTMLWFCSDNGPEGKADQAPGSAGPFKGRKRDLWEGGIRVPGILEWPAVVTSPRVTDVPCVTTDFLPTVLDFLDVKVDGGPPLDGISLRPLIENRVTQRKHPIGFEYANMAAWLDDRYKLVALLTGADADEGDEAGEAVEKSSRPKKKNRNANKEKTVAQLLLFDILADPQEAHDLSAERPDVVDAMRRDLETWRNGCRSSAAGQDYADAD